jgi:hypothetical protein
VTAGNALEFYDFVTYAFFATQIGHALFPGNASSKLLLSLATFGVGFLTRPLGGIIIGRMADRRGRKPAMILSFTIMGVAMTGLALTPSYAVAGMLAPLLTLFFRLLQGFALGGEVGPNIAYLMEAAPPGRRGLYISLNFASADADFNRGVSRAEFQAAAGQRFLALDMDHKGYLTLPILETIRPAPPAAPKAPERPKDLDESALPDESGIPRH